MEGLYRVNVTLRHPMWLEIRWILVFFCYSYMPELAFFSAALAGMRTPLNEKGTRQKEKKDKKWNTL